MSRLERILVLAVCVAVGWFYVWTVRSSGDPWKFGLEQRDYYNLLIDGWLDGQLHMKVPVPEALLQIKDPYDPAQRPPGLGLHDATFFKGKYYLYFGAAPVVVLMLPFRLWSGIDLPLPVAALIFVYGAFLATVALWVGLRRRYFAGSGTLLLLAGVLVLGLAGLGPVLLRRPHMWELPIGAGSCFAMLCLWCIWQSLHASRPGNAARQRRRAWWYGGAGLCLGLAIASRPTYLIGSPFLLIPLLGWWRAEHRLPWRPALSALVPLAIIGSAMAWHNYARFEHPLQFGQAYQFSLDYESKMAHFRATHVPFNVWRYFWSPAEWTGHFPFIRPAALPPKPPGFGGHDDVYGLLTNLPIAWLALAAPLALWLRDKTERRVLRAWLVTTAVLFGMMAGTLVSFFGSLARYQSDFTPALMLLAVVGMAAVDRWLRVADRKAWRVVAGVGWGAAAAASAVFGILFSLQLDGLLREKNPVKYREVARSLNRIPAAFETLAGVRYGPVELALQFGAGAPGTRVVLLAVGEKPWVDRVVLVFGDAEQLRFEIESGFGVKQSTRMVRVKPGATHRLRVTMGSLLPDEAHPIYGAAPEAQTAAVVRHLQVEFDGESLVDLYPWVAAPPGTLVIEPERKPEAAPPVRVANWRRDEPAVAGVVAAGAARAAEALAWRSLRGAVQMQVSLPRGRSGTREPLIVTGRPGAGDILSIEYVDERTVRFVFDHWGMPALISEPVAVDYARVQDLRIAMESLRRPERFRPTQRVAIGELEVRLDGRSIWRLPTEFFVVSPVEVAVARNAIGGTSCGSEFTGVLQQIQVAER